MKRQEYLLGMKKKKQQLFINFFSSVSVFNAHSQNHNACDEDEQMSYGFGTTCVWVINEFSLLGKLSLFPITVKKGKTKKAIGCKKFKGK